MTLPKHEHEGHDLRVYEEVQLHFKVDEGGNVLRTEGPDRSFCVQSAVYCKTCGGEDVPAWVDGDAIIWDEDE